MADQLIFSVFSTVFEKLKIKCCFKWQHFYIDPWSYIQGSMLFFTFINDLSGDLVSTAKLFVDDASILSIVKNTNSSTKDFDDLLVKISNWELQWKISFNPDQTKNTRESFSS